MPEHERNSLSLADRLNAEALVKRQQANKGSLSVTEELLLQAGGYSRQENTLSPVPASIDAQEINTETTRRQPSPEGPRPILTLNGPVDPRVHNLETEYRHLEAQAIELTLTEEGLKARENPSDSMRKQLISIGRKRDLAKKRMGEIKRALTEMREVTRNAFPPHSTLAPETSRARAPQYWRGTTVAETLEPATMIDEEITHSPIPMESPSSSLQEATRHNGKDLAAKLAERAQHDGVTIDPSTILSDEVRMRVEARLNGDAAKNDPAPEQPKQVSVADLEAADIAATEIPHREIVAEDYAEIQKIVDALPQKEAVVEIPVADTETATAPDQTATPETPSVATTSLEQTPEKETRFEETLRKINDRDPEQANRILNTIEGKDGPIREKFLKAITATETQREQQVERAQKSLSEKAFGFVKNMGEQYKSLSFAKKVGIGMALTTAVAGGIVLSGGTLSAALVGGLTGRRIFGAAMTGMVAAIAVEASRKRYHEKKNGGERTEQEAAADRRRALLMGLLATGGILVAGGQIASGATQLYEQFGSGGATAARIAELQKELGLDLPPREETSLLMNDPGPTVGTEPTTINFNDPDFGKSVAESVPLEKIEVTIKPGDNLWNLIKEKVDAQQLTANLTPEQKTYFIDSIKDKFAAMSPEELETIGFENGNINMIHAGKTIDLTKVLGDTSFLPGALHDAEMLDGNLAHVTPEAAAGISEQVVSTPATTPIEDLPASITETPTDELHANSTPVVPENVLRDGSGEVVRDGFGDPVRTGEGVLENISTPMSLEELEKRQDLAFLNTEIDRLDNLINEKPDGVVGKSLDVIYPSTDGEVWAPGERNGAWTAMRGQSAWELLYRPESLDHSIAADPATSRMRIFVYKLTKFGISPEKTETVEHFLRRGLEAVAAESPNETWSA